MKKTFATAAAGLALALTALPVAAQDVKQGDVSKPAPFSMDLDGAMSRGFGSAPPSAGGGVKADPQQVMQVLQGAGYQVQMQQSDNGPFILGQNGNAKFGVFFLACTNGANCLAMQFYTNFDTRMSVDQVNQFNLQNNFASAVLEQPGTVGLEMELITLQDGVSQNIFLQYAELWKQLMGDLQTAAGY